MKTVRKIVKLKKRAIKSDDDGEQGQKDKTDEAECWQDKNER